MRLEITEAHWLDAHHEISLTELVELSGLSATDVQHLVDCEALLPLNPAEPIAAREAAECHFSAECLTLVRTASRLRDDFDLDANGLALALQLLNRIHELEADMRNLRARLPAER